MFAETLLDVLFLWIMAGSVAGAGFIWHTIHAAEDRVSKAEDRAESAEAEAAQLRAEIERRDAADAKAAERSQVWRDVAAEFGIGGPGQRRVTAPPPEPVRPVDNRFGTFTVPPIPAAWDTNKETEGVPA